MNRLLAPRRRQLLVASTLVLALLVLAATHSNLAGLGEALAYLLPALLLLVVLAARRYPGERTLLTLITRSRGRYSGVRARDATPRPLPRVVLPRGGRLIACSLAVRPPPVPAAVSFS